MYRAAEVSRIAKDSGAKVWVTVPRVWAQQGPSSVEDTDVQYVVTTEMTAFASDDASLPENQELASGPLPTTLPTITLTEILESHHGKVPERPQVQSSDTALFIYTSGTTGPPKAAMTTHGNLCFVGNAYAANNGLDNQEEVIFAMAPLVHVTGMAMHVASWLVNACTLVVAHRFHPKIALQQMQQHGVTWTTGTSTAYQSMMQLQRDAPYNLPTLDFAGVGGSSVPSAVTKQFYELFNVQMQPGYGLTETTGSVTSTQGRQSPRIDEATGVVSAGPTVTGVQIMIADDEGRPLAAHEQGEVLVKGPGVAAGYWQRQDDETFRDDGWTHTGDIGFMDEDDWLYIVDRKKNLIVASGYKIWPREVEEVLYKHSAVNEVAVVGAPDKYRGETVVAFVALNNNATVTEQELIDYCRGEIAAYKVPSRILRKSELPKNFNGKIQVRELKSETAEGGIV
jgi:long-chain acyl-CoA synthetase